MSIRFRWASSRAVQSSLAQEIQGAVGEGVASVKTHCKCNFKISMDGCENLECQRTVSEYPRSDCDEDLDLWGVQH